MCSVGACSVYFNDTSEGAGAIALTSLKSWGMTK
jgi:hypothetical protein